MYFFTWTAVAVAVLLASAAAVLFVTQKHKTAVLQTFIAYLATAAAWIGANSVADIVQSHEQLLLWSGIATIAGAFEISAFLFLIYAFITEKFPSYKIGFLYITPTLLTIPVAFSPYSILETQVYTTQPNTITPGNLYVLASFLIFTLLLVSLVVLIKHYKKVSGIKKQQTIYVLIGFCSIIIGQLIFQVILPILGETRFFNIAPQFALIFALTTGYAIFKYQLFDIKVIAQRSLIYATLLTLIIILYSSFISFTSNYYTGGISNLYRTLFGVGAILFALITIPALDKLLRRLTDPLFFAGKYEYQKALHELSTTLNEKNDLNTLITHSETQLSAILRAMFVSIGQKAPKDTVLVIPIPNNPKVKLFIGPKKSGSPYTNEDNSLLQTFANQISVALSRALLFKEVTDRAEELERRVEERTIQIKDILEQQRVQMLQLTHNLQTPLTILTTHFEQVREYIDPIQFQSLERSIQDVSNYITRLLRLARLESGQEPHYETCFSLSALLGDITEEVSIIAEAQNKHVISTIQPKLFMNGDETHIREAFLNVISNAIKYATSDSTITLSLTKDKTFAKITCHNFGITIQKEDIEKIFTPFYRSKNHEKVSGTGLGLAITKQIIDRHHGLIKVTSSNKTGTKFTILLPITATQNGK